MENRPNIELRSDEVTDILRRPPGWVIRWGITGIMILIIFLLAGSLIFKYPDKIVAPITISSENMPVKILTRSSGRLTSFFVRDHESVKKDQIIAVIENTTDLDAYFHLSERADSVEASLLRGGDSEIRLASMFGTHLGELQEDYTSLYSVISEYNAFVKNNYHRRKAERIRSQIKFQKMQVSASSRQLALSVERSKLSRKNWERDSTLYTQKAISTSELERSRKEWLEAVNQYENQYTSFNNLNIQVEQAEQTIFDLEEERSKGIRDFHRSIKSKLDNLRSSASAWEKSYLLKSPVEGRISLSKFWDKNQNIGIGEVVATVIPSGETKVIGKIYIPVHGAGKVKIGQKVNVKIDNYPYLEYGMVTDSVEGISEVPAVIDNKTVYIVTVQFPRKLVTGYKIEIPSSEEMTGVAEIITTDISVLKRIIYPIRHMLERVTRS